MDMSVMAEELKHWVPIRIYQRDARTFVDWCYMDGSRFLEPFFDQTIERRFSRPFNLLFRHQTPIEFLGELYKQNLGLPLKGLIFHMSRCGSTLISQVLASIDRNVVISEAGPIDTVLRFNYYDPQVSDETRAEWLRWVVAALGQRRAGSEENFFVKLDCWHTLYLPLIESAFPDVPWLFVYREPVEVIVSHGRRRGAQMIPGVLQPEVFGMTGEDVARISMDEYCARVLAGICEAALRYSDRREGFFVNYNQLPEAIFGEVADHFRFKFDESEAFRMRAASRLDAKNPVMAFEGDGSQKQSVATEELRRLADEILKPLYARLERKRLGGESAV